MRDILDLARWAPSGDNEQPWEFEIVDDSRVVVYGHDTREHCVYDLKGQASQMAFGTLFETMAIAASAHRLAMQVERRSGSPEDKPVFDVTFTDDPGAAPGPLVPEIKRRSVQRRPMQTRPLTGGEKAALEAAAGPDYQIQWLEGGARKRAARLMFDNARLRLLLPEAYRTHARILKWDDADNQWGVPAGALGVDRMTIRLMQWAMKSESRLKWSNRILGTAAPRLQMDLLPGLACAAHFVIRAPQKPETMEDFIAAGRAMQRVWLTLTHLGLVMQPEMTPLIFSSYVRSGTAFTANRKLQELAERLSEKLARLIGSSENAVVMGRIGAGKLPVVRSERKPLDQLLRKNI
ncbi:molybdopterin biosynthesis protein MoeY [Massilia cavernae]|uniref:Molybdopterin biosynthesis protein MoeY n=2 Tax=Massilia cavernae TaxID=2320864 RepID=A0A418Y676_9BURK|nr:molybdopterin biosynthesis protein MoeY [Massilia cavernae]